MIIKKVSISEVDLWDDNPRNIKKEDFERLKKQIKELGVYKPMVACRENGKYVILGGNMRLRALRELGVKEVDISVVEPKSEAEKIKFALSDNDRAGVYEEEALAELIQPHLDEIDLEDFKIDLGEAIDLKDVYERFGPDFDGDIDYINEQDLYNEFSVIIKCENEEEKEDVMKRLGFPKRSIHYKDFIEIQEKRNE